MGQLIIIDGPEKSGKSTLIAELTKQLTETGVQVHHRRWSQIKPDDRVYTAPLQQDLDSRTQGITIWDRGWPSEHVYGQLLNRPRRGATNPWILEWLHGRAVEGRGAKVILLPNDQMAPAQHRDSTDLPVNPRDEYSAYYWYATEFRYDVCINDYTQERLQYNVAKIIKSLPEEEPISAQYLTHGNLLPLHSEQLIVGEARNVNDNKTMAGAWLPFSSAKMCKFVQQYFGTKAFRFAWCNAEDFKRGVLPAGVLRNAREVFTFGAEAKNLVDGVGVTPAASFSHPAFFARWNTERGRAALAEFEKKYVAAFNLKY